VRRQDSAYHKELLRIRLEEICVNSRIAALSADKKIDAEAEKNLKQLWLVSQEKFQVLVFVAESGVIGLMAKQNCGSVLGRPPSGSSSVLGQK
jgi:hypothetical protein